MEASAVELFDMYIAHIGINAQNTDASVRTAQQFASLLGLPVRQTPISRFAGSLVEVMDKPGRGAQGHLALHVNDIEKAASWFEAHGHAIDQQSWLYQPDGSPRLVYFQESIAGFAIHLTAEN